MRTRAGLHALTVVLLLAATTFVVAGVEPPSDEVLTSFDFNGALVQTSPHQNDPLDAHTAEAVPTLRNHKWESRHGGYAEKGEKHLTKALRVQQTELAMPCASTTSSSFSCDHGWKKKGQTRAHINRLPKKAARKKAARKMARRKAPLPDGPAVMPETEFADMEQDGYRHREVSILKDVEWESEGPTLDDISSQAGLSKYTVVKSLQKEVDDGEVYEHRDGRYERLPTRKKQKKSHSIVDEVRNSFNKHRHKGTEVESNKKPKPGMGKPAKKKKKPETAAQRKADGEHRAEPYKMTW